MNYNLTNSRLNITNNYFNNKQNKTEYSSHNNLAWNQTIFDYNAKLSSTKINKRTKSKQILFKLIDNIKLESVVTVKKNCKDNFIKDVTKNLKGNSEKPQDKEIEIFKRYFNLNK